MPEIKEKIGQFLGIANYVGDALTYWFYFPETGKIIVQSCVQKLDDKDEINQQLITNHEAESNLSYDPLI